MQTGHCPGLGMGGGVGGERLLNGYGASLWDDDN